MIKILPHNLEAEKAILGSMIRSSGKLSDGIGALDEDDFFSDSHQAIYSAMFRLSSRGVPVDTKTLVDELTNSKELEIAGGPEYLFELVDSVVTFANFNHYVTIVQEQAVLRRFLLQIEKITDDYNKLDIGDVSTFLGASEKKLRDIAETRKVGEFQDAKTVAIKLQDEFKNLKESSTDDSVTGTPTGFVRLNRLTHGFQKGEYIVLAARPGVGKTALALNLAYNAAVRNKPVGYFSLEMPASMLFKRLISAESNVPFESLITGFGLNRNNSRLKLDQACKKISDLHIYVDDTSGLKLMDLCAKVRTLANREPDLGLVVVDYIGLVDANIKSKGDSRQQEVQVISQTLKKLALELKIPIIGVAQLNRKVDERPGGEPILSDLRESGSIEQDADIVMLLHEPKITAAAESKDSPQGKKSIFETSAANADKAQLQIAKNDGGPDASIVNVIIAKNRSGKQGRVPLLFRKSYCKFDSPSSESEEQLVAIDNERVRFLSHE